MKEKLQQIRFLFIPYLTIAVFVPAITALFSWGINSKYGYPSPYQQSLFGVLHMILSASCIFFFLRNRLHMLRFEKSEYNIARILQVVLWMSITLSSYFAWEYFHTQHFALIHVNNVAEIDLSRPSRYYKIDNLEIDRTNIQTDSSINTTTKRNRYTYFYMYFAIPVKTKKANNLFWYGVSFHETIRGDNIQKFNQFIENSKLQFFNYKPPKAEYYENIENSDDRVSYYKAISKNIEVKQNKLFIFKPVSVPFYRRGQKSLMHFIFPFAFSTIVIVIACIRADKVNIGKAAQEMQW